MKANRRLNAKDFVFHCRPFSLADYLWSAWLLVPSSVRLSIYHTMWRFATKHGGNTSSPMVKRLVPFNLYAKEGTFVSVNEALATQYVRENTTIPVPRILDAISLPEGEGNLLLMTGVKGRPYGPTKVSLDTMPEHQRVVFTETLRGWFDELRSLQPPDDHTISGFMGAGVFSHRIDGCETVGPYSSQDEFHAQYFCQPWEPYDDTLCAALAKRTNTKYRIRFTHGDISPHNILVDNDLRPCALIDWECAGWMPEYWEYTRTLHIREKYVGWKRVFTDIFPNYDSELTVERAVWKHYFP